VFAFLFLGAAWADGTAQDQGVAASLRGASGGHGSSSSSSSSPSVQEPKLEAVSAKEGDVQVETQSEATASSGWLYHPPIRPIIPITPTIPTIRPTAHTTLPTTPIIGTHCLPRTRTRRLWRRVSRW